MKQPTDWKSLERHELSAEYADLSNGEWESFLQRFREKGFDKRHPITLHDGKVLDGWQRLRACIVCDCKPTFIPLRFIHAAYLQR